jgi:O-antigen chain-terminating methyltransferase
VTTQPNALSLYHFSGEEITVRHIQSRLVNRFEGCSPVLDIGCGRGIFLSLLKDRGIDCVGIDHAYEAVVASRNRGFEVEQSDCLTFLAETQAKFSGIFCSHVIEHLDFEKATELLRLCRSVMHPGGRIIVVTPNPEDINVMCKTFWLDPTHVRPYPGPLVCAMLTLAGFHVSAQEMYSGGWRVIGRRNLPAYLWKKFTLGKNYGLHDVAVTAVAV